MGKLSAFSPIHSLLDIQYIVFEITKVDFPFQMEQKKQIGVECSSVGLI